MRLTAVRLDARGSWEFDLDNGITVRLGRRQIDERFARFVAAAVGQIASHANDIRLHRHALHQRLRDRLARGRSACRERYRRGRQFRWLTTWAKRPDKNLIIGLDVGTSKVSALVGEVAPDNTIEVIGIGTQPSRGLKKGVVVNIESTVQSIQRAIEEAELMAGCEIRSVFAGIAGSHVRSLNSHGVVAIRDREVSDVDVQQVVDAAKAVAIPGGPEDPARAATGIHHRRPGRHPRSDRHVGRAARGQGAHRHRRRQRGAATSRSASSAAGSRWTTSCSNSSPRVSPA